MTTANNAFTFINVSVQTDLAITVSPFEHGRVELLFLIFAIAGVILGLLMILQSIYTLFKKPQ